MLKSYKEFQLLSVTIDCHYLLRSMDRQFFIDANRLHRSLQGKDYVITEDISTEIGTLMSQLVLQRPVMSLHELLCLWLTRGK